MGGHDDALRGQDTIHGQDDTICGQNDAISDQDTMSITNSDAFSIFSHPEGPQSSVTSLTSDPSVKIENLALDEFVALLLGEAKIGGICAEALSLQRLTAERLWRNLKRLLKSFAKDLMKEGDKDDEKSAAALFRSRTSYILNALRKQLDKSSVGGNLPVKIDLEDRKHRLDEWLRTKQPSAKSSIPRPTEEKYNKLDDASDKSEESEEDSKEENNVTLPALNSMKTFILKSEALSNFQRKLRSFIYPTFASELESLPQMFSQDLAKKGTGTGRIEVLECYHRLEGLVLDLVSVELDSISISYGNICTRWDRMKRFVESATGRRWDWWPFLDPIGPIEHIFAYICWKCVSGSQYLRYTLTNCRIVQSDVMKRFQ
jgi:hypothetical protein